VRDAERDGRGACWLDHVSRSGPTSIAHSRRIWLLATVLAVQRINAHGRCSVKCSEKKGVPCHAGVDVLVRASVLCGCGLVLIKGQKSEED
jgi:hypothetical protein